MARTKGSYSLAGTLEVLADAPADARLQVKTVADLTANGSFPYKYVGMIVSVETTHEAYMLIGSDPTVASNWQKQGEGGTDGVELTQAEYNALSQAEKMNGKTYYITDAQGSGGAAVSVGDLTDVSLSSLSDGQILQYDGTNEEWVNVDVPKGGAYPLVTTLPEPTSEWHYKKVQYIGATSQDRMYVNGTVYYCRPAPTDPASWAWYPASQDLLDGYLRFVSPFTYDTIYDQDNTIQKSELRLMMDETPTSGSALPVRSRGLYTALANKQDKIEYSSTEKVIGTWFGSTLYERTIQSTTGNSSSAKSIYTLGSGWAVRYIEGYVYNSSYVMYVPITAYSSSNTNICCYQQGTALNVATPASSFFNCAVAVTIRYTK